MNENEMEKSVGLNNFTILKITSDHLLMAFI